MSPVLRRRKAALPSDALGGVQRNPLPEAPRATAAGGNLSRNEAKTYSDTPGPVK